MRPLPRSAFSEPGLPKAWSPEPQNRQAQPGTPLQDWLERERKPAEQVPGEQLQEPQPQKGPQLQEQLQVQAQSSLQDWLERERKPQELQRQERKPGRT